VLFALQGKLAYHAAMTDNRDIDEILASLDTLLREGDSHDATPAQPIKAANDIDNLEDVLETNIKSMNANLNELLDHEKNANASTEAVLNKPEHEETSNLSRVVLTEDMMVENPQVSLPLSFNSETPSLNDIIADAMVQPSITENQPTIEENKRPNHETSKHVAHLHKQEIEQLLSLVSLDISEYLQQTLPKLIKESLHTHLANMQHESDKNNKRSDDN